MTWDILFYVCVGAMVICGVLAFLTDNSSKISRCAIVGMVVAAALAFLFWGIRDYQAAVNTPAGICPKCEGEVVEEYNFCPECGATVRPKGIWQ